MATKGGRKAASTYTPTKKEMLKMATNGQQKVIEIGEKEYTLQHPGVHEAIKIINAAKDDRGFSDEEKFFTALMKQVVVSPRVDWKTADEIGMADFMELMKEAGKFLTGK